MYFLDNNSGIATMPPLKETQSTTPLWFTEGDGHKGISWPGEDWFNIQQAEQLALLEAAGIRPDKGKLNQLTLAIRAIIGQEALLKTQALAEIAAAGKGAQEKARTHLGLGKLATQDGIQEATVHRKGIVQLNSAPRSADETTAATPKEVNDRVNEVVDNAPSDLDTLNKLAKAISNNPKFAENVMQLLSQKLAKNENGADIPDKNQFVKNLGLLEMVVPVGVPLPWPTETPLAGWLICNGQTFNKTTYPQLAMAYPTGNLPDLRGEFIRGWDDGRGVDPGRKLLSLQPATQLPSVYTYAENATSGVLVTPPISSFQGAYPSEIRPRDYEEGVFGAGVYFTTNKLLPGGSSGLSTFRVRPRNLAFNYIVRAA